ncbi:GGDEF domain-containing protein [Sphingobium sp. MK2]|uniref:GGDEF domain-containing protein n=1 Tax=Sphingobium sp. MK2 TaxID=3116540 RepID=UPI0032E36367
MVSDAMLPDAVYRDLVSTLFTMATPIMAFGLLYLLVGTLIYLKWQDPLIAALTGSAMLVTIARVWLIKAYSAAGRTDQDIASLKVWEGRYAFLTYISALLLAGLHIRALSAHEPLVHIGTISLIFTFGSGIVSRNASRPRLCLISLLLVVGPTAIAMLTHAASGADELPHPEFFVLQAFLLVAVTLMSLQSVRHLYISSVEHLTTKHDLATLARYDPLTGLPNRLLLRETFQANVQSSAADEQMAVHYLDLDGFKAVNDRYGHPAGDAMLREVARRLQIMIRAEDVACRLGGDEFLLLQCQVRHQDQADLLARRIIKQLSEPYLIDGVEMRITASVGIAMSPEFGLELERLMAFADTALYRSKAKGKAQVHFCTTEDLRQSGQAVA